MPARFARSLLLAAAVAAITPLAACDSSSGDPTDAGIEVVASTNVYADIASSVGGDRVQTTSFLSSPDQDPHSYEATGRNILTVSQADLVIENGGGYDDFMDRLLEGADGDPVVLNVVELSGLEQSASGGFNEHVWYNLEAAQQTADEIAADLGSIDGDHAAEYRANAAAFNRQVQQLIDQETSLRQQVEGSPVAITEPVPGYMLDALGLEDRTPAAFSEAVEEGEDVAVSVLADTLRLFEDHLVEVLVYNEQTTGAVTEQVLDAANAAGVPVVPVTETLPAGEDYVAWMRSNLTQIADALGS
jgi:zinc/manganese transport system substrate-binding protein